MRLQAFYLKKIEGKKDMEGGIQIDYSLEGTANSDSSGGNKITLVNFE